MKVRLSLLALLALFVAASSASAQYWDPNGGGAIDRPAYVGNPGTGSTTTRVFTDAVLTRTDGTAIGKVKAGSVQSATELRQGVAVRAFGLAPNTEYALVIDGVLIGTGTSDATGNLRMRFMSPSNGRIPALPESVLPIVTARTVALYLTSNQQLIANGQFAGRGGSVPK
jgi:hypothetical protein